jgi:UDP:flavonoid glycosyltransferase YjiC (YdhE family)
MTNPKQRIAYFISPHGFGHAARASAVMEALSERNPTIYFDIYTTIPSWFFQEKLSTNFYQYSIHTDIGLAHTTPFQTDLPLTIEQLDNFYPFQSQRIVELANQLKQTGDSLVICDISPLGLETAKQANIPSVLIENFTWDWIYGEYEYTYPQINSHIQYLKSVFQNATFHIQTEPICARGKTDLFATPVSRKTKISRAVTRNQLGIKPDEKMILITTGGIKQKVSFLNKLISLKNMIFVIPGGNNRFEVTDNIIQFPHHSDFFHPDLVNASDAVIGKAGYSTIAEVYHAQVPFGHVSRPDFRESQKLVEFIEREMTGLPIQEHEFQDGTWVSRLEELLALPKPQKPEQNGADLIADFIIDIH